MSAHLSVDITVAANSTHLHKPEFKTPILFKSQKELSDAIFNKEIMVGIVFDGNFEKNIYKKKSC
jgi:ABC-2 type transport system permease protein